MKNLKSVLITLFVLICSFFIVNCEKEDINVKKQTLTPELIGKIHNRALDNIVNNESNFNFNVNENGLKSQIIKANHLFLAKEVPGMRFLNQSEEKSIELLNTNNLISKNFSNSYNKSNKGFSMEESNVFDKINFLHSSNVILDSDKEILDELYTAYKDNYQGKINEEELLNVAKTIRTKYQNENSDTSIENVFITLSILEICVNSLEWFDENIVELQNKAYKNGNNQKVLFWNVVAADAIGAVVGIGLAIVEEGIRNGTNGPVNGESVIYGAVEGAVTGSVGSVIGVGKWISKLF